MGSCSAVGKYETFPTVVNEITLPVVLFAVLSLTVLRIVPSTISPVGTGLQPKTVALIGWFGPRGTESVVMVWRPHAGDRIDRSSCRIQTNQRVARLLLEASSDSTDQEVSPT